MITSITLENFKSIQNTTTLKLPPLTVFTGSNSSGKSTVLQAILVLSQSSLHAGTDRQLVLNGSLTRLGQFQEIRNYFARKNQFSIGITAEDSLAQEENSEAQYSYLRKEVPAVKAKLHCSFTDQPVISGSATEANSFPELQAMATESYFAKTDAEDNQPSGRIFIKRHGWTINRRAKNKGIPSDIPDSLRQSMAWNVEIDENSMSELQANSIRAEIVGASFHHFLPRGLVERVNLKEEFVSAVLNSLSGRRDENSKFVDDWVPDEELKALLNRSSFAFLSSVFVNDYEQTIKDIKLRLRKLRSSQRYEYFKYLSDCRMQIIDDYRRDEKPMYWLRTSTLPRKISEGNFLLRRTLKNVRYIGPLRINPSPIYPIANTLGSRDVGPSGEWTAAVLDEYKDTLVPFIPPGQENTDLDNQELDEVKLLDAVNAWVRYLDVAESVQTVDRGSLGHELFVTTNTGNRAVPLTQVGVGVSQCLPVVVSLLLAPLDSTTLLEQPELHLHPAVQSRLADFILSMTISGRQCVVETHSEYFINKLRLKIAVDHGKDLTDQIAVYFSENNNLGSIYREIEINSYGKISNWPVGFFDQSNNDMEALVQAAIRKRSFHG